MVLIHPAAPNAGKFVDRDITADSKVRASVAMRALETLWFNTGTLCNLTCANCYIESSPCTLLPYDPQFDLGPRLADAFGPTQLNHPHCAKFCVLGGGRCGA